MNGEQLNTYVNVSDICGNCVSDLATDINYDIYNDFEIVKYVIYHTIDISGFLYYSIDRIDCITDNWVNEMYDVRYIKCNAGDINLNVGVDTEYKIYNKNKLSSELFGMDCAGNTIFWFEPYLNETEIREQVKLIKNFCMRTNLIKAQDIHI